MVFYACNASSWEADEGLYSEFQVNPCCSRTPV